MAQETYTENLADFGARERGMLRELLDAWNKQGLPSDFSDDRVRPAMNMNSGFVFLVNEEYETAMMNGDNLESFYSSPYEGREGFFDDLAAEYKDMYPDDQEWLRDIARATNRDIEGVDLEDISAE